MSEQRLKKRRGLLTLPVFDVIDRIDADPNLEKEKVGRVVDAMFSAAKALDANIVTQARAALILVQSFDEFRTAKLAEELMNDLKDVRIPLK